MSLGIETKSDTLGTNTSAIETDNNSISTPCWVKADGNGIVINTLLAERKLTLKCWKKWSFSVGNHLAKAARGGGQPHLDGGKKKDWWAWSNASLGPCVVDSLQISSFIG